MTQTTRFNKRTILEVLQKACVIRDFDYPNGTKIAQGVSIPTSNYSIRRPAVLTQHYPCVFLCHLSVIGAFFRLLQG